MESNASLKFGDDNAFHREVRRRVDDYFHTTGRRRIIRRSIIIPSGTG